MGAIFSGPKLPKTEVDTSAADEAKKTAEDEQRKQNEELAARRKAIRAAQIGRFSLITSGSETGLSDTLG